MPHSLIRGQIRAYNALSSNLLWPLKNKRSGKRSRLPLPRGEDSPRWFFV